MLTAGLQPGFGPLVVALLDLWSPEHVLGVCSAAALPRVPVASSGMGFAFGNAALGREVLQGRLCSSANSSGTQFPLLLTTDILSPPGIACL